MILTNTDYGTRLDTGNRRRRIIACIWSLGWWRANSETGLKRSVYFLGRGIVEPNDSYLDRLSLDMLIKEVESWLEVLIL